MKYEAFDVPDFPQSVEEIVKPYLNSSLFSIPLLEFDFDFYGTFGGFIKQASFDKVEFFERSQSNFSSYCADTLRFCSN